MKIMDDRKLSLKELKEKYPAVKSANAIHQERLTFLDKTALFITERVGTMGFFFFCVILVTIPLFAPKSLPVVQYISSGYLQLILLPLIMVGQNLQSRHSEIRSEIDFKTNIKAEKEIETILLHLEEQQKLVLQILHRLEDLEKKSR